MKHESSLEVLGCKCVIELIGPREHRKRENRELYVTETLLFITCKRIVDTLEITSSLDFFFLKEKEYDL